MANLETIANIVVTSSANLSIWVHQKYKLFVHGSCLSLYKSVNGSEETWRQGDHSKIDINFLEIAVKSLCACIVYANINSKYLICGI